MNKTEPKKNLEKEDKTVSGSKFVYVIYIRTTKEKLWEALTQPEFTKKYWCATWQESDWKQGSTWKMIIPDGRVADAGEILEIDKPNRLVLKWQNQFQPHLKEEGYSTCTYLLEETMDAVKLTITHVMDRDGSELITAVSNGWPKILGSLKSLLETGESLEGTRSWEKKFC